MTIINIIYKNFIRPFPNFIIFKTLLFRLYLGKFVKNSITLPCLPIKKVCKVIPVIS